MPLRKLDTAKESNVMVRSERSAPALSRKISHYDITSSVSVCHIASGDGWGGAEAQVATLLKTLGRRKDVRVCAIVLNDRRLAEEIRESGVDVRVIPESRNSLARIAMQASDFIRGRDVQIIHSHRYKENLLALALAFRYPVRLVRTQHGQPEPASGLHGAKQRFVYSMDRLLARHTVDNVVSVSAELTGYLQTYVDPRQIKVIPNGIALDAVVSRFTREEAKQRLFIRPDVPVVGIATRLTPIKRLDLFIQTAQCIVNLHPSTRFVIAGDGAEAEFVRRAIDATGLQHEVMMLGHRGDVHDVIRAMDVFLLTSDHEGLPIVILEAMALGTPIVSRRVGGIPEAIQDGCTGCLVDSADPSRLAEACVSILRDDVYRKQLAEKAKRHVELNYSADKNAAEIVEIYRGLLARNR